jgi:beta-glucosidase-like glycosyl hydrolase
VRNRVVPPESRIGLGNARTADYRVQEVVAAVRSGELDPAVLDESVRRILRIIFQSQRNAERRQLDVNSAP